MYKLHKSKYKIHYVIYTLHVLSFILHLLYKNTATNTDGRINKLVVKSGANEHLIPEINDHSFRKSMSTLDRNVIISISIISELLILMKTDCSLRTGERWSMPPVFAIILFGLINSGFLFT